MSAPDPIRTRPVRRAPPPIRRFAAAAFIELARRTKFVDPALAAAWEQLVGAEIAALCRPGRLSGGRSGRTLDVIAPNGAAAARVQFEAEAIRRKVNNYLGPGAVGRVAVRQAGGKPLKPPPESAPGRGGPSGDGPSNDSGPLSAALSRFRASITTKNR